MSAAIATNGSIETTAAARRCMANLLRMIWPAALSLPLSAQLAQIETSRLFVGKEETLRQNAESARQRVGNQVITAVAHVFVSAGCNHHILPPVDGIGHRRGLAARREARAPQYFSAVGIEGAQ